MTDDELLRYSRQLMLPQIDVAGQEKLGQARVLIIGMGGLGSPVALYLAASGVGQLTLVDHDQVDLTNLQRQIVHTTATVGLSKVESAKQTLQALNPHCQLHTIPHALAGAELAAQVAAHEVVVDCTDNFASRFALNAACVQAKVPLVSAAAIRLEAQMTVFDARNPASPCYHCLYEESDELDQSCTRNGVLAPLVGTMGSLQALECIKLICGFGTSLVGRLLILDASTLQWRELRLKKNPECPVCAH